MHYSIQKIILKDNQYIFTQDWAEILYYHTNMHCLKNRWLFVICMIQSVNEIKSYRESTGIFTVSFIFIFLYS